MGKRNLAAEHDALKAHVTALANAYVKDAAKLDKLIAENAAQSARISRLEDENGRMAFALRQLKNQETSASDSASKLRALERGMWGKR